MSTVEIQNSVNSGLLGDIYDARVLLSESDSPVQATVINYDEELSDRYNANIWLASELHQVIGAYKIRGAYNFLRNMSDSDRGMGVVTASAGNHAQGIALSSNITGVNCEIFMPVCTPVQKVNQVALYGGEDTTINLVGETFDEAQQYAMKYAEERGAIYASPFNDTRVIAGQGTWGLEIADCIEDLDMVLCPVGGMGLLAGISTAIKARQPGVRIVGVEPRGAASLRLAYQSGKPYPLRRIDTFVDGAAVKKVGRIPFDLASHLISSLVSVGNLDVRRATTELWQRQSPIKAELAGALSVAALNSYAKHVQGKNVVCLVTGGNLSEIRFHEEVKV